MDQKGRALNTKWSQVKFWREQWSLGSWETKGKEGTTCIWKTVDSQGSISLMISWLLMTVEIDINITSLENNFAIYGSRALRCLWPCNFYFRESVFSKTTKYRGKVLFSFFFFWPRLMACGDLSSLTRDLGIYFVLLEWKHGVLTTEPPGKLLKEFYS